MKLLKSPIFLFCFVLFTLNNSAYSQVIIDGKIDIKIGLPDIVITKPQPRERKPRPVIIKQRRPEKRGEQCNCNYNDYIGTVMNQNNGPRFDYKVVQASIDVFENNVLSLILHMDTQDIIEIVMVENNFNDYNFHYNNQNQHSNRILQILINNVSIPLSSAAVSLQPKESGRYSAVLNLHSRFDGDFNGIVERI